VIPRLAPKTAGRVDVGGRLVNQGVACVTLSLPKSIKASPG
jgi:hypothetical protein